MMKTIPKNNYRKNLIFSFLHAKVQEDTRQGRLTQGGRTKIYLVHE